MIRLVFNFEMHHYANAMSRVLCMIDPRCTSLFLSNTVGNQIKRKVDDVNCDKMIDGSVARSGWRFPAQKLTKTRPLQQKPAQNFNLPK